MKSDILYNDISDYFPMFNFYDICFYDIYSILGQFYLSELLQKAAFAVFSFVCNIVRLQNEH